MSAIPAFLRRLVLRRAAGRCEYCRLSQAGQEATFHIDHIIPLADNGATTADNLDLPVFHVLCVKAREELRPIYRQARWSIYSILVWIFGTNISDGMASVLSG